MTIGVAVIGAGMAGRAHAAAYRIAPTLYESTLPDLRFVSIGDVSPELGSLAARRFGFERNDTSWQAIAEDPDIKVVSVVVANFLHREMVEGLVAAGKHVLCEKPLSDNLEDARAMADLARSANTVVRIGLRSAGRRASPPSRTRHIRHAGSHLARRRPLLVRLCERPQGPMTCVQGSAWLRRVATSVAISRTSSSSSAGTCRK